jgi:hypothetical protein
VPALGLTQGGFSPDTWVWAGALAAWGTAVAVVVSDHPGGLRRAWPWFALAGGLLAWTIASGLWSAHGAQSVLDARRTLCYAAALLALVTLTRPAAERAIALTTCAAIVFVVAYALVRYLLGGRVLTEFEGYLLSDPVGYANGLGILAALGMLLGLGLGSAAAGNVGRAAYAATIPMLAAALELTSSRASWLALGLGLGTALVLEEAPVRYLRFALAAAAPAALLVLLARESGLAHAVTPRIDGWEVALAAVGCMLAAGVTAVRLGPPVSTSRRPPAWALVAAAAAAAGVVLTVAVVYGSSEPRATYYRVAWHDEYRAHPLLGTGAGTFALYWARSGHVASRGGALDAHSLYLETLAELGPVGLALLLATLLYPLRAAIAARRSPAVSAAASAYVAFLVHAGLDWDWELPVVVIAGLCCGAAVVSAGVRREPPLGGAARGAVLVAALVLGAFAIAGARSRTEPAAAGNPAATERGPAGAGPWDVKRGLAA